MSADAGSKQERIDKLLEQAHEDLKTARAHAEGISGPHSERAKSSRYARIAHATVLLAGAEGEREVERTRKRNVDLGKALASIRLVVDEGREVLGKSATVNAAMEQLEAILDGIGY